MDNILDEFVEACCCCSRALHKDKLSKLRQVNGQYCCSEDCYKAMTTNVKVYWPDHPESDDDGFLEMPYAKARALGGNCRRALAETPEGDPWLHYPTNGPRCALTGKEIPLNDEEKGVGAVSFSIDCGYPSRYDLIRIKGFLSDEGLQKLVKMFEGPVKILSYEPLGPGQVDDTEELRKIFDKPLED